MVPADQMANPLQHTSLTDSELLMREAIQNSVDERRPDAVGPVRFKVRRMNYLGDEKQVLVDSFGLDQIAERAQSFPKAGGWYKLEENCLAHLGDPDSAIPVLLLSDHNTNGLGGHWNTRDGIDSRFYNLVLSIYASKKFEDASDLLGSYGVGKMVYAVTSRIRTMAYYSVFHPTQSSGNANTRFMATAFLPGHRLDDTDYSGHAFLGESSGNSDYPTKPLENSNAHEFAVKIGLDRRSEEDTGLTVMLLDCPLSPADCLAACEKYWWPRTINSDPTAHVDLEFFDGDKQLPPPKPRDRNELKQFIDCFSNVQQGVKPEGYESLPVNLAPGGEVGRLCLTAIDDIEAESSDIANTVALIRGGLVIQYNPRYAREGDPAAVGIFEAQSEEGIKAFTLSEPEAHDEWNHNNTRLFRSLGVDAVSLVRRTHDRIKNYFRDFQTRQKKIVPTPTSEGLDFLDDLLGTLFKKRKKRPPPSPEPKRRAFSVKKKGWRDNNSDPTIDKLNFTVSLMNDLGVSSVPCLVRAVLKVLEQADGRPGETIVCEIFDDDGGLVTHGSDSFSVELTVDSPLTFHASAPVHPSWRTKWAVSVARDDGPSLKGD